MKTNLHYSNVKPISPVSTTKESFAFWFCYVSFGLMILAAGIGMDLLKLWLK